MQPCIPEAAILVFKSSRPDLPLRVILTSMQMKSQELEKDQGNSHCVHVPQSSLDKKDQIQYSPQKPSFTGQILMHFYVLIHHGRLMYLLDESTRHPSCLGVVPGATGFLFLLTQQLVCCCQGAGGSGLPSFTPPLLFLPSYHTMGLTHNKIFRRIYSIGPPPPPLFFLAYIFLGICHRSFLFQEGTSDMN